jgi:cobalt-zinc-cadmium efflux system protein
VLYGVWRVFREATSILIDSTPRDLDYEQVRKFILGFSPLIRDVHDLHIWTLGEGERALMAHLAVEDGPVSSFQPLLGSLNSNLQQRFDISHITLELECGGCKSGENVCLN